MSATPITTSAPRPSRVRGRMLAVLALAGGLLAAAPAAEAAPFAPAPAPAGDTLGVTPVQYHGHRHWGHRHHGWGHRHWGHHHHGWGHRHRHWGHRHHGWGHRHHGWGHRHGWGHGRHHW